MPKSHTPLNAHQKAIERLANKQCKYCEELPDKCGCSKKPEYFSHTDWKAEMLHAKEIAKDAEHDELNGSDSGRYKKCL